MEGFQLHKKNSPPRKTRAPVWSHRAIVLAKVARSSRTAAAAASKQASKHASSVLCTGSFRVRVALTSQPSIHSMIPVPSPHAPSTRLFVSSFVILYPEEYRTQGSAPVNLRVCLCLLYGSPCFPLASVADQPRRRPSKFAEHVPFPPLSIFLLLSSTRDPPGRPRWGRRRSEPARSVQPVSPRPLQCPRRPGNFRPRPPVTVLAGEPTPGVGLGQQGANLDPIWMPAPPALLTS